MAPSLTVCGSRTPFARSHPTKFRKGMSLVGRLLGRLGMPPVRTPRIGTLLMRR
jgi:hypothetical protein